MPRLNKQIIGKFIDTGCKRQLFLNLQVDTALDNQTYPARMVRPAIQVSKDLGLRWEADKFDDLVQAFSSATIIGKFTGQTITGLSGRPGLRKYDDQDLYDPSNGSDVLSRVRSYDTFIFQPGYKVPNTFLEQRNLLRFRDASPFLEFSSVRPDIIWVREPGTFAKYVDADGRVRDLPAGDERLQLQIIDIKLTAAPSRNHYAEVTYYILVLAAWLRQNNFDQHFVVIPDGGIWPGSVEISALLASTLRTSQPTALVELRSAFMQDIEVIAFEALAQRLDTFFSRDLPEVLTVPEWKDLPWHINQSCATCDFLGIDRALSTLHDNHCHRQAFDQGLLTQVAFLGRGGKAELEGNGIITVDQLRTTPSQSIVFTNHNQLRAERTMLVSRADALRSDTVIVPPGRKTIAIPSPWDCDLKIFLTLDFDPGSGLTYAFGFRSLYWPPRLATSLSGSDAPSAATAPNYDQDVFIVPDRTPDAELQQLVSVLEKITTSIKAVEDARQQAGYTGKGLIPRVQFYIWDNVQAKHIKRVLGRHIDNFRVQSQFQSLIWRFPPESVLPDPGIEQNAPVAVIKPALRQLVGLPLPYDYSLLKVARIYRQPSVNPAWFDVSSLFESGLGDQIPFERAHEIWTRQGYRNVAQGTHIPWNTLQMRMEQTVAAKLLALDVVVGRLEADLRGQNRLLLKPKAINIGRRPPRQTKISLDGRLWLNYAKLEAVSQRLEVQAVRAMEVDEREARYQTAVLTQRLQGTAAQEALNQLDISPQPNIWVYRMRPESAETKKLDPGEFLWALAPRDEPGFLERKVINLANNNTQLATQLTGDPNMIWTAVEYFTGVTVLEVDRDALLVALIINNLPFVTLAEQAGLLDFTRDAVLDRVYRDYWTDKLERCLKAIGNPDSAVAAHESRRALGEG